jgi:PD-(D/E)XK endonuclease
MSATRSSTRRPPASRLRTVAPVHSLRRELTTKRRGELAELVFQLIATRMGFAVCKPYGDSERYDFVLDARQPHPSVRMASLLWRVQVKASTQIVNGFYRVHASHRRGRRDIPYRPGEIDFIAAYIIPEDTWYIIPIHAVGATYLLFRRKEDRRPSLYGKYKEAWHLLRPNL